MQQYKDFRPTAFDPKGYLLDDRQDWYVAPVMRTRDSGILASSNFEVALEELGGESKNVEIARFNHWGPGWFEILLVRPDTKEFKIAQEIESSLENYPLLSDEDYSEKEWEAMTETWENASLSDRIWYCERAGVSFLKARHNELPEGIYAEHLGVE